MVVDEQIAGAVRRLPIAPECEPQAIPSHAGELRHVLIDHAFAIGVEIAGRAIVGRSREHVVRAKKRDLLARVLPPYDALFVEEDALRKREDRDQDQGWYSRYVCPTSCER